VFLFKVTHADGTPADPPMIRVAARTGGPAKPPRRRRSRPGRWRTDGAGRRGHVVL